MAEDAFSGSLSDLPLDTVLGSLATNERRGVLRIGENNEIWLDEGQIYLVLTPNGADPVSLLFGGGEGTIEELTNLLLDSHDVASTLVERNPDIGPHLGRLIHEHNLHLLFELLVPSGATFAFEDGQLHPMGSHFREPTDELIDQAKRRLEIWSEIATRIPSTAASFRLAAKLPDHATERVVTSDEWEYLALLDGRRSVADVITITNASAFRVCSSLYRLLLEGVIEEVKSEPKL